VSEPADPANDMRSADAKPVSGGPLTPVMVMRVLIETLKGMFIGVFDHQDRVAQAKAQALATHTTSAAEGQPEIIVDEDAMRLAYSKIRIISLLTFFFVFLLPLALTFRLITSHWWLGTRHTVADITVWHLVFAVIPFYFLMILGMVVNGWVTISVARWTGMQVSQGGGVTFTCGSPTSESARGGAGLEKRPLTRIVVWVVLSICFLLGLAVLILILICFSQEDEIRREGRQPTQRAEPKP